MTQISTERKSNSVTPVILALCSLGVSWVGLAYAEDSAPVQRGMKNPFGFWETQSLRKSAESLLSNEEGVQSVLKETGSELRAMRKAKSNIWESEKFQAYYHGLPVVGSEASVHRFDDGDRQSTLVMHSLQRFDLDTQPALTAKEAVGIARTVLQAGLSGGMSLGGVPTLKILAAEEGEDNASLAYEVKLKGNSKIGGYNVWVDAQSGRVLARIPHRQTIAPIHVLEMNEPGCQDVNEKTGEMTSFTAQKCKLSVHDSSLQDGADESSVRALANSRALLNYYQDRHGRNSFDGKGADIVNLVHAGKDYSNAYWNSELKIMAYGDGDGVMLNNFTNAIDVAGHEMTHGVVSATADLLYFGESGALNEAYADFFGQLIDQSRTWVVGERLMIDKRMRGIRDLANPGSMIATKTEAGFVPYPAHMNDRLVSTGECDAETNDNCWVHVNSTIPGHASYLIFNAIGIEKAEQLYYTVLTQFLNSRSNFRFAAQTTKAVCKTMYDKETCDKVTQAFAVVGL